MYLFGFSLNMISLLALTLVIGVLVDDAIVEIENIVRHLNMGKSPCKLPLRRLMRLGLQSLQQLYADCGIFANGIYERGCGTVFSQFGWTAVIAIFISLLVARLLTPMMAAYILRPSIYTQKPAGKLMTAYLQMVAWTLKHRTMTVAFASGFLLPR